MSTGSVPMFRPLLAFMAGIVWAYRAWPMSLDPLLFLAMLWVGLFLCCGQYCSTPGLCSLRAVLLWLLYFALGLFTYQTHNKVSPDHWEVTGPREGIFTARILESASRNTYDELVVSMNARVDASDQLHRISGEGLLFIRHEEGAANFPKGSFIAFRAAFQAIQAAKNPYSFDQADYWEKKGIHQQAWIGEEDLVLLKPPKASSLAYFQNRVLNLLKRLLPEKEQLGIAAALVMGDKSILDREVKSSYADSGAIHVLAVSGLHVGLVYGLFYWLIGQLAWVIPLIRHFRLSCLLLLLIGYAAFTGASPSVCRAVLMLSCWMIGKALYKTPSAWNVLSVSAFLLLIFDPGLLFDLGFQLSYSAVWGILFLYPMILRCWSPRYKAFQYAWKLVSVSVAAQLGTLPWSLFYFHQFPTYFGLSSLLIIPLVSLILITAFAGLIFSWEPFLCTFFGWILHSLIDLCNETALFIQQLPMSLVEDIWIREIDILLYFALLVLMVQTFLKLSFRLAFVQFILLLLWGSTYWPLTGKIQGTSSMIIYHTNDFFVADWLNKGNLFSLAEHHADSLQAGYASRGWRSFHGISDHSMGRLPEQFARSDTALNWNLNEEEFLLVGPSSRILPDNDCRVSKRILIADPENPWTDDWLCLDNIRLLVLIPRRYSSEEAWSQLAEQENIPVWSIKKKGAFEYKY